jgi:hypothetical protein
MTKKTTMNSKDIIIARKKLDETITKYWHIIKTENVMSNKAVKMGIGSGLDLKELYNQITQMSETRIKLKLMLNAINNGTFTFNYEEEKKKHYYTIFAASEEKEKIAHWKDIIKKTIDPKEKARKGMKGTGKREIFSSAKITSLINSIQLNVNKFDTMIEEYNNKTQIDIGTDNNDDIASLFAA